MPDFIQTTLILNIKAIGFKKFFVKLSHHFNFFNFDFFFIKKTYFYFFLLKRLIQKLSKYHLKINLKMYGEKRKVFSIK